MSVAPLHHERHAGDTQRSGNAFPVSAAVVLIIAVMLQPTILIRSRHRRSDHVHILGRDHSGVIENNTPRVSELVR